MQRLGALARMDLDRLGATDLDARRRLGALVAEPRRHGDAAGSARRRRRKSGWVTTSAAWRVWAKIAPTRRVRLPLKSSWPQPTSVSFGPRSCHRPSSVVAETRPSTMTPPSRSITAQTSSTDASPGAWSVGVSHRRSCGPPVVDAIMRTPEPIGPPRPRRRRSPACVGDVGIGVLCRHVPDVPWCRLRVDAAQAQLAFERHHPVEDRCASRRASCGSVPGPKATPNTVVDPWT